MNEESSNESSKSECESEASVLHIDGWEDMTMGDKEAQGIHVY